jgi:hypothetical protein
VNCFERPEREKNVTACFDFRVLFYLREVDNNAFAYLDYRIDLQGTNYTYFATNDPTTNTHVSNVTSPTLPQFPLIVGVPFNITFKIVDDTKVEVTM